MSDDARIREVLTMIEKELPEIDTVESFENLERDLRHRGHRRGRALIAAAAVVVVAGGVYGLIKNNSDATNQPAHQPSASTPQAYRNDGFDKTPGTYRMLVGVDDTGAPINADVTFYDTWETGDFPVYRPGGAGSPVGGMAIYQPLALAAGSGCLGDPPNTNVADTPMRLARQLARLPRSTVLQQPTTVHEFGHQAVHLAVRINQQKCPDIYRIAETLHGNHGISYGADPVLLNFWVQSHGGIPVVIETWCEDSALSLMDQIARTEKSITFVTGP
jgi:hypothetical protein